MLDKYYQLCEVLDDDLADVAIVVSHMMAMAGVKTTLTHVRDDFYNGGEEILLKYEDFIEDALDTPLKDLRAICDKKLSTTTILRATIKELKAELQRIKNQTKKQYNTKKVKVIITVHEIKSLFEEN